MVAIRSHLELFRAEGGIPLYNFTHHLAHFLFTVFGEIRFTQHLTSFKQPYSRPQNLYWFTFWDDFWTLNCKMSTIKKKANVFGTSKSQVCLNM